MEKNLYELLGAEKTANAQEIKRAYYTLVKRYPPERFPEEYKSLRAAYDILSDEKKRAEYDRSESLPSDAAPLFEHARKLEEIGRYDQSAEVYELILRLHPKLEGVTVALARSFEMQGKNGKAISVWKKLCALDPENTEYAYELALSYDQRGWRKKAFDQYRRALELDDGNVDCWLSLLNCRLDPSQDADSLSDLCEEGIRALKRHGKESIRLYAYAAMFSLRNDTAAAKGYLGDIVRAMRAGLGDEAEHAEEIVRFLLETSMFMSQTSFVKYIREMAETLPRINDDLRDRLAKANREEEIESLEELGFSVLFYDLLSALNKDCGCEDCKLDLAAMEYGLLADMNSYRSELLRLRKEFPFLYELHADFFNEALRTKDIQKLLYRRVKILSKKGVVPTRLADYEEFDNDFEPMQTVRRTEAKIGRNDPCPCGSGKKYKNCCGK
ncbi:MAG: DnaJ domain-containing protein [Clostridiales Family XIII bacterium]|jgi:curved DNA-binding protein CbpA|nr:DnaJ domain-containing protein [Clostridiales Family XIII bacterium]